MTIGSLFSGIGGLELGLELAGLGPTIWQVERDPFCRGVLAKHWPDAERFDDVCTVGAHNLPAVDILCGGSPCQDISYAGKGAGLAGERSGLWRDYARIVGELRPRFVVVENVPALLTRGLDTVLSDLAAHGYDAIWLPVRAADVGAPHKRERLFIVAYASGGKLQRRRIGGVLEGAQGGAQSEGQQRERVRDAVGDSGEDVAYATDGGLRRRRPSWSAGLASRDGEVVADSDGVRQPQPEGLRTEERRRTGDRGQARGVDLADAYEPGLAQREGEPRDDGTEQQTAERSGDELGHAARSNRGRRGSQAINGQRDAYPGRSDWGVDGADQLPSAQPRLCRAVDGLPAGLDGHWPARPGEPQAEWEAPRTSDRSENRTVRLKALGNAVCPQVGYIVGCVVKQLEASP